MHRDCESEREEEEEEGDEIKGDDIATEVGNNEKWIGQFFHNQFNK